MEYRGFEIYDETDYDNREYWADAKAEVRNQTIELNGLKLQGILHYKNIYSTSFNNMKEYIDMFYYYLLHTQYSNNFYYNLLDCTYRSVFTDLTNHKVQVDKIVVVAFNVFNNKILDADTLIPKITDEKTVLELDDELIKKYNGNVGFSVFGKYKNKNFNISCGYGIPLLICNKLGFEGNKFISIEIEGSHYDEEYRNFTDTLAKICYAYDTTEFALNNPKL